MVAAAKATALTFIGVAKEATPGTAVAPTFYIPMTKFDPLDDQRYLDDLGWRNSMALEYGEIQGVLSSEIDFGGDVYADSLGWFMSSVLGDVTTTGASAPFSHAMGLLNSGDGQPTSFTMTDYYGRTDANPARQFAGARVSEITLKADAEQMFTYEGKMFGYGSAVATKPTPAFTAITPEPGWEGTATFGGASKGYLQSFETTFTRQLSVIFNIDGNVTPYQVHQGALSVKGKLTVVLEDDTELNRYLTPGPFALVLDYTHGAGAGLVEVKQQMSQVQYISPTKINRSKDYVALDIEYKAIANATDVGASGGFSPALVTLKNALPASTYH